MIPIVSVGAKMHIEDSMVKIKLNLQRCSTTFYIHSIISIRFNFNKNIF